MLKVKNLCKSYPNFCINDISFELPKGYILGFLGKNGAGKTTTIKAILNIVHADSGSVEIMGKDLYTHEVEIKQDIGFILGAFDYYPKAKLYEIARIYSDFFINWDNQLYKKYLKHFEIDETKRVTELSAGMKVKFGLALALSHKAKLLILDEPTSGLDPIARDDLLDIFQEIIQDGETSILFSTHITSDLDKCADYILMIKNGKILANSTKDELIDNHALISGNISDLNEDLKNRAVGIKHYRYNFKGLIKRENIKSDDKFQTEKPNLEDIMIYYNLEAENE